MANQVPGFDTKAIATLAAELYGIEGEISPLVSYEDQNARITARSGTYVVKIANKRWPLAELQMQTEVLGHLGVAAPQITVPKAMLNKKGEAITVVDGFAVRVLTYLEGALFTDAPKSPALYFDMGRFMGRFTSAMQGYAHPAAHRPHDLWNLDNVLACKVYLNDVQDVADRERISRFLERYEKDTQPKLRHLRKSVIHSDANEQNLLVAMDGSATIAGVIDFGDLVYAATVNDLAITLAYTLLEEEDLQTAAKRAVEGYIQEFPLEDAELEVLGDLVAMRLVQSVLMSSNRAKDFPDNDYILVSQKPAKALLKKLEAENLVWT